MGFRDRLENLLKREEKAEELESRMEREIGSGSIDSAREDSEKLASFLEELESGTLKLLSREGSERRFLLEKNEEFVRWYVESIEELGSLESDFRRIDSGLKYIFEIIADIDLEQGKVNIWNLGWNKKVLSPARKIVKNLDELEKARESIIEDLGEEEEELVLDEDMIKAQKSEIQELSDLVKSIESGKISLDPDLRASLGLDSEEFQKLERNLRKIEELEEQLEDYESRISSQKRTLNFLDRNDFARLAEEIENKSRLQQIKKLLNLFQENDHEIIKHLDTLEELARENKVVQSDIVLKQIEVVRNSFELVDRFVGNLKSAKKIYLGEIIKNRKKQVAKDTYRGGKRKLKKMTKREFLKAVGNNFARLWALDAGINILSQKITDQDAFMDPKTAFWYSNQYMIEDILKGKKAKIAIFNVYFGGKPRINGEEISNQVKNALETLSEVNVEVRWIDVDASVEGMIEAKDYTRESLSQEEIERLENYTRNFKEIVENNSVVGEVSEKRNVASTGEGEAQNLVSNLEGALYGYINEEKMSILEDYSTTKVFLSDFKLEEARGVSTHDALGSGQWVLAHRSKNQKEVQNLIVHELGHKFSLPHSYSQDIMSYSPALDFFDNYFEIPFGPESKANWEVVKKKFDKWQ